MNIDHIEAVYDFASNSYKNGVKFSSRLKLPNEMQTRRGDKFNPNNYENRAYYFYMMYFHNKEKCFDANPFACAVYGYVPPVVRWFFDRRKEFLTEIVTGLCNETCFIVKDLNSPSGKSLVNINDNRKKLLCPLSAFFADTLNKFLLLQKKQKEIHIS